MIGKFGEGIKVAVLALVRSGYEVKIRSGSECWVPQIVDSEKFKAKVLAFDILTGRKDEARVRVEVKGIPKEEWLEIKERFLFLTKPHQDFVISTSHGELLLHSKMQGRIYVKGIYVEHDPKLQYGYNLAKADLDRDRRMVERWTRNWEMQALWQEAIAQRPDLLARFARLLESTGSDLEGLSKYSTISETVAKEITKEFQTRHGENAIPVSSIGESKEIEHLGKTGIVVPEKLGLVLTKQLGSLETVKDALKEEVVEHFSWSDLSTEEKDNLETAILLVSSAVPSVSLDLVEVVQFRSGNLLGQYKSEKDRVLLARKNLASLKDTLTTLVHEVAHRNGGDGEKGHVAQIEDIWGTIITLLWKKN